MAYLSVVGTASLCVRGSEMSYILGLLK